MSMSDSEQLMQAFVRFVPHALEALTALEHLVVRLFFFGLMIYGLLRLVAEHSPETKRTRGR